MKSDDIGTGQRQPVSEILNNKRPLTPIIGTNHMTILRILTSLLHQYFNHDKEGEDENEQWNLLFKRKIPYVTYSTFFLNINLFYILNKFKKKNLSLKVSTFNYNNVTAC